MFLQNLFQQISCKNIVYSLIDILDFKKLRNYQINYLADLQLLFQQQLLKFSNALSVVTPAVAGGVFYCY